MVKHESILKDYVEVSIEIVGWDDNMVEKLGKSEAEGKYSFHNYFLSVYYMPS